MPYVLKFWTEEDYR